MHMHACSKPFDVRLKLSISSKHSTLSLSTTAVLHGSACCRLAYASVQQEDVPVEGVDKQCIA
jgi:hypothetical protein